jgi:hypothetical protein
MANSNGWGDGAANNSIGWGQGANNNIGWGDSHAKSWAGLTDIVGTSASPFDANAQAFITAANITNETQQTAIDNLVIGLKTDGIWTKMNAIYPFVGGTATQHKYNLKDPRDLDAAYRIQFFGGVTHSSNGVLPNGTNGYSDTKFNINPSYLDGHFSTYFRTLGNGWQAGINSILGSDGDTFYGAQSQTLFTSTASSSRYALNINSGPDTSDPNFTDTATSGLYVVNRNGSSTKVSKNNVLLTTSNNFDTPYYSNGNFYLLARNKFYPELNESEIAFGNRQLAFATIGRGLTDLESISLYNRIQTFNQTLGRQVGVPIVSDSDAQAFLNSAEITDLTQANAINTLVTDLKAQGLWTKMKAVYPFVGGTASTHKWNLKDPRDLDAAYRLVFNGGWTHSSTGATPNGTNGYADTKLNELATLSLNSAHLSHYSRTNVSGLYCDIGTTGINQSNIYPNYLNAFYPRVQAVNAGITINYNTAAFFLANRVNSTQVQGWRNSVKNTLTNNSLGRDALNIYIGAGNSVTGSVDYSVRQCAFSSIGDGLTDTEAAALYTAVQTYQTTLSRNV